MRPDVTHAHAQHMDAQDELAHCRAAANRAWIESAEYHQLFLAALTEML